MPSLLDILRRIVRHLTNRNLPEWTVDESSSPCAVAGAIERLVRADEGDRAALGRRLAERMRLVGPREWTQLYARFRRIRLSPGDVTTLADLPRDDAVEMLGVATLSANGYTREAALRALERLGHPRALPYVLLRLGDWVEQVRAVAARTLRSLMDQDPATAAALVEQHHLIDHLRIVERVDLSRIRAEIEQRLRTAESRTALEPGLTAQRAATRLFCLRLLEGDLAERPELVALAMRDQAPLIRGWIAGKVARAEITVSIEIFRALLCDRASRVATTMIRSLSPEQVVTHRDALLELALADARSVRESARFVLIRDRDQVGHVDFADACRARLDAAPAPGVRPGWVACLGETGDAGDFNRVVALLEHARGRVRAAAVTAVARLDRDRATSYVVRALADTGGRVRRAAIAVLADTKPASWLAGARDLLCTGSERGRAAALTVLTARGGWDAVPAILDALASDSDRVRQQAWQVVCDWNARHGARGWLRPSADCLDAIARTWPDVAGHAHPPERAARDWAALSRWIERVLAEHLES